jgi:hypothetical protein
LLLRVVKGPNYIGCYCLALREVLEQDGQIGIAVSRIYDTLHSDDTPRGQPFYFVLKRGRIEVPSSRSLETKLLHDNAGYQAIAMRDEVLELWRDRAGPRDIEATIYEPKDPHEVPEPQARKPAIEHKLVWRTR